MRLHPRHSFMLQRGASDFWIVLPLILVASLLAFWFRASRIANRGGHDIWSIQTLAGLRPYAAIWLAVLLVTSLIWFFRRRTLRHPTAPDQDSQASGD